jgi:hypothetical protein
MRATSNLKHQSSNTKEEASDSRTPDFEHQAPSRGLPFLNVIPSAPHALDRRSEIPRSLAATVGSRCIPEGLNRQARDGGFLNSVVIPYPFRTPSELPRESAKPHLTLGVVRGALVETRARNQKRRNESEQRRDWRGVSRVIIAQATTMGLAA